MSLDIMRNIKIKGLIFDLDGVIANTLLTYTIERGAKLETNGVLISLQLRTKN